MQNNGDYPKRIIHRITTDNGVHVAERVRLENIKKGDVFSVQDTEDDKPTYWIAENNAEMLDGVWGIACSPRDSFAE